jgi:hypothetical protein
MVSHGVYKATVHGRIAAAALPAAKTYRLELILYSGAIQACYEL